jgi:hypothetical protein
MKLILFLLFFASYTAYSQELPVKDGKVFYEQVDSLPGILQAEVYKRAKLWMVNAFKDAKEVIQLDDKETGDIVGKGLFRFSYRYMVTVESVCRFTIKISSRENKYRAQVYDIIIEQGTQRVQSPMEEIHAKAGKAYNKKIIAEADKGINAILADLRKAMTVAAKDDF